MLERILVPLDGSETSEAILGKLLHLFRRCDAQVILFQSVPIPGQPGMENGPFIFADLKAEAERYISAMESHLRTEGVNAQGVVRVCGEATGILEVARHYSATVIAMATHGRTGLSRLLLGSVTESVLRESDIPVLAVRSFEGVATGAIRTPAREIPIRRILMPVDRSESSLAILPYVRDLAKAVGASVLVLGVVEPVGRKPSGEDDPVIRMAVDDLACDGIPVDPLVRLGDPASEILDASVTHEADLIAMTTHGRRGVSRLMMGSVTERVLRATTVPVLSVTAARLRHRKEEVQRR